MISNALIQRLNAALSIWAFGMLLACGDSDTAVTKVTAGESAPRFMLAQPNDGPPASSRLATSERNLSEAERKERAARFTWHRLVEGGPAAMANPVIGVGSGKPYYSFADGQPYPYYIVRSS